MNIVLNIDKEALREALDIKQPIITETPPKLLMSRLEVMKWLGVGSNKLEEYIAEGMPRVELAGKIKYVPAQIIDWLASRRI